MNQSFPAPAQNRATLLLGFLLVASPIGVRAQSPGVPPTASAEYQDFNPGPNSAGADWVKSIIVHSPALRSEVQGDVPVTFEAPGMTAARALCWQQPTTANPDPAGHDAVVADLELDDNGDGAFVFPADKFPNGPITLRILVHDTVGTRDMREVQLFNRGGVVWNQGIPKNDPPAAAGMKLLFADDFDKPLAISRDGQGATYCSHKPGGGDFSGWRFSDFDGPTNPFSQEGTFLRIHATKAPGTKGSTGLLASARMDGTGVFASAPCYFECRFLAQSAPGTWPAFWTLTKNSILKHGVPADELDIVEAYGGGGKGNPNHPGYSITSHFWKQTAADGTKLPNINKRVDMSQVGNKAYWSTTFHTYGVKVTDTDTIYYLDNVEMLRHPTGPVSKSEPMYFLMNYAIGGISGWKIDLDREGNTSDMWVDFVRVYQGDVTKPSP